MTPEQGAKEFDKLFAIIEQILNAKTRKEKGQNKTKFTQNFKRLANKCGADEAREIYLNALGLKLLEIPDDPDLRFLFQRIKFMPGYYFQWNIDIYGWYEESQLMAEKLPLFQTNDFTQVSFDTLYKEKELWNQRGFYEAESPPYVDVIDRDGKPATIVVKNRKESGFWNAYKWWKGCRDWYYDMHPEWFGSEKYYEDIDNET